MDRRFASPLTAVFYVALFAMIGIAAQAREFRSVSGGIKLEAEVVAFDGKTVRLALAAGAMHNVQISSLHSDDQAYLKKTYPEGLKPELIAESEAKGKNKEKMKAGGKEKAGGKDKAGSSGDKPSFKVEMIGVSVAKPIPNLPAEASPVPTGTHLLLMVTSNSASIAGLNAEKSRLSTFEDNKGTDLTEGATGDVFEFIPLPDGKSALVHIHQTKVPAAKSVRATLKGVLHLTGEGDGTTAVPLNFEVLLGI